MTMAQLFANENLPEPVVAELRRLGHDARTMRDAGQAGRGVPDREVLDLATAQNRAVVTLNRRHFVRLHDERPGHAGIIVCTFDLDFAGLARRIDEAIRSAPDLRGRLIRVNRPA
jgi:predicted nuclease of predicted toxin-antitoxin system